MNIFGAFTFGSLIKTFLPGLVWLVAFILLEADAARYLEYDSGASFILKTYPNATLVLAIPASILLGLLSNIIVFMGLNDKLVRDPVKRGNPELFGLYDAICNKMRDLHWEPIDGGETHRKSEAADCVDVEITILRELGVQTLAYVREQYWYYLEFTLNLMLAFSVLAVAVGIRIMETMPSEAGGIAVILVFIAAWGFGMFMTKAARKNYRRHIEKMLSLILSMLSAQQRADIAATKGGTPAQPKKNAPARKKGPAPGQNKPK